MSGYAVIPNCPVATCSPPYVTRFNLVVMYVMRKRLHKAQATDSTMLSTVAMGHDSAPVLRYFRERLAVGGGLFTVRPTM